MTVPTPAPSRFVCVLAWLVMATVPLLILGGIMVPWAGHLADLDAAIVSSEDQLARYRRLVRTLPGLSAELEKVRSNEAFKAFYFNASTPALAGAELQRQVQDIVTAANGRLISTQLLPEQEGESPPRVRVRTQIQCSTDALLEVLYQIEQARPFLFVDQISVRSSARPELPPRDIRGRPVMRTPINPAGDLTVRLDIFGFALGGDA